MQSENGSATQGVNAWLFSLKLWAGALVLYSVLGLAAWWLFSPIRPAGPLNLYGTVPVDTGFVEGGLMGVWLRWDGIHYLRIAQEGYSQEMLTAYFPLYPFLGRWVGIVLGISNLAGLLIISRTALLIAFYFLYRITSYLFNSETAKYALFFTAFFPTSVYLFAPYPLSLALMFSLGAVWFALQQKWLPVALAGLLAGLTHGTTVPLAVGLGVLAVQKTWRHWHHWPTLIATCTPILGTGLFLSWRVIMGFPDYRWLLSYYWFRISQPPWMIIGDFKRFFLGYMGHADGWINLILLLIAFGLTIWSIRKLVPALWIYQVTSLIFLCSTTVLRTPFGSTGRYLLLMFPLFIELAVISMERKSRLLWLSLSLLAALFVAMVFIMWGWLA